MRERVRPPPAACPWTRPVLCSARPWRSPPPGPATARLLLKQAKLHEEIGDVPAALAAVDQAAPHLDDVQAPRHRLVYEFNRAEYLRQLGRQAEAEALLPAVRALSERLANDLDNVRLRWLEARMAASGGGPAEATAAFRAVRNAFAARGIAYDLGLVTLELAAHLLEQSETAAVQALAAESERNFKAQQVDHERYGAILVFCRAAAARRPPWSWCASCWQVGGTAPPGPAEPVRRQAGRQLGRPPGAGGLGKLAPATPCAVEYAQ